MLAKLRKRLRELEAKGSRLRRQLRNNSRRRKDTREEIERLEAQRDLIAALERKGVKHTKAIVEEAKRQGFALAKALALCQIESGFEHIFGCDLGPRDSVPYCHQPVTKDRTQALLRHVSAGGTSNGVSLTQLTSAGFLFDAENEGGLHTVRACLRVGFDHAEYLHDKYNGSWVAWGAYNGGEGNPIRSYADKAIAAHKYWLGVLGAIDNG